jgi:hypothetical protein
MVHFELYHNKRYGTASDIVPGTAYLTRTSAHTNSMAQAGRKQGVTASVVFIIYRCIAQQRRAVGERRTRVVVVR